MVRFIRSTWPLVQGCLGLVVLCSMSFVAQAVFEGMSAEWLAVGDGLLDQRHGRSFGAGRGELDAVARWEDGIAAG